MPRSGGGRLGQASLAMLRLAVAAWAAIWGLLSAVGQRRAWAGTTMPEWTDLGPGIAAAAAGGAAAFILSRALQGFVWKGLMVSLAMSWVACAGLDGTWASVDWLTVGTLHPGRWWLLIPFVFSWGLLVAGTGTRSLPSGLVVRLLLAVVVGGVGVGAALGWSEALGAIGATRLHVVTSGLLLAGVVVAGGGAPSTARSAPLGRRQALCLVLAAGAIWWAVPATLWSGSPGVGHADQAVACFAAMLASAWGAARLRLPALSLVCALLALAANLTLPSPFHRDSEQLRSLATNRSAQAVYTRCAQELQLWSEGRLVDGEGPDRPQSALTATVLGAFAQPGDRVLLLGLGTGRLLPRLAIAGSMAVDAVDFRRDAGPLLARLSGAGPVQRPDAKFQLGVPVVHTGPLAALAGLPAASRQAIVVAEPLHAGSAWQTLVSTQLELRRVVGRGLVVQTFAMDRTPPTQLRRLFGAASLAHAWNGVLVVGDCGVLLSAAQAPVWPQDAAFEQWPDAARWQAHVAHLGDASDLQRALCGTLKVAVGEQCVEDDLPEPGSAAADRSAVLALLHEGLQPASPIGGSAENSVLLGWVGVQARLHDFSRQVRASAAGVESAAHTQRLAAGFLPIGAPTALLQAALCLPDTDGVRLRNAEVSSRCALALDPTFFALPRPPLFADLPVPVDPTGALEDLADLPAPERLVERCCGDQPLAIALRARFPSACAQALVSILAKGPIDREAMRALREVADPFVLVEAGRVLVARGARQELLALWRGDLSLPRDLLPMASGDPAERMALVGALAGRRDAGALGVLANAMVDPLVELRRTAAESLSVTVGERIPYDPEWPQSRLLTAAEQVRALHNRMP